MALRDAARTVVHCDIMAFCIRGAAALSSMRTRVALRGGAGVSVTYSVRIERGGKYGVLRAMPGRRRTIL